MSRRPAIGRWFRLLTLGTVGAGVVAMCNMTAATASSVPAAAGRSAPAHSFPSITVYGHGRTSNARVIKQSGIVPQRAAGAAHSTSTAPKVSTGASVYPPNTATSGLTYHGGSLELTPHVYLDFWGTQWKNDSNGVVNYLVSLFNGLGASGDSWSTSTSQYRDVGGHAPAFSGAVLAGAIYDYNGAAPSNASQSDIANEADYAASVFKTSGTNADIVVVSPSGTHPDNFPNAGWCAWHSWTGSVGYTNLPYVLDAGGSCGANSVQNALDGFSIVAGHEYAEAVTDPVPGSGYLDSNGEENGDLCAWDHLQTVSLGTGTFAMQPLYSDSAGGCVYSSSGGGGTTGALHAVGSGKCLDVPGGSQTNGTATEIWDCNGGANQTWTHTSGNQLTVYGGKCLDATANQTAPGTAIEIWDCNGGANQQWALNSNGTITGVQSGLCLDVTGASTADGATIELWTCNGGSNQQWTLG